MRVAHLPTCEPYYARRCAPGCPVPVARQQAAFARHERARERHERGECAKNNGCSWCVQEGRVMC